MHTSILPYKPFNWFSNFKYKKILKLLLWGPDLGGSFHCRCEQTQTQQAQYNEFGREADLRTGPLWGRLQWSGGIIGELDRLQRGWGEGQSSSSVLGRGWFLLLLFWYSIKRTSWRLPNCRPLSSWNLPSYIFFYSLHLGRPSVDCAGHHLSVCLIQRFLQLAVSGSG